MTSFNARRDRHTAIAVQRKLISTAAQRSPDVTDTHLPAGSQTLAANTFGEAAIDLTASGLATGCGFSNATTFLKSRSSATFNSEI